MTISPMRTGTISTCGSKVYTFSWHIVSGYMFMEEINGTLLPYNNHLFILILVAILNSWLETWMLGITIISCTLSWQSQLALRDMCNVLCYVVYSIGCGKTVGSGIRPLGFKSQLHHYTSLDVLLTLSLSRWFFIWKTGVITIPISQGSWKNSS